MKNDARKKISDALLAQLLNLDYDVLDIEEIDALPTALPEPEGSKRPRADVMDLRKSLDYLVGLGCRERVLYWCLERLGSAAGRIRMGEVGRWTNTYDEEKSVWRSTIPKLATQEQMTVLLEQIQNVKKAIHRNQRELLLAADTIGPEHPLPNEKAWEEYLPTEETIGDAHTPVDRLPEQVLVAHPMLPVDAMQALQDLLTWVTELAECWRTPNLNQLVRSKGILYLLVYVWMKTKTSAQLHSERVAKGHARKTKLHRLAKKDAQAISHIAQVCDHRFDLDPQNLIDKLQDFHVDHPNLHRKMVVLLEAHEEAMQAAAKASAETTS